MSRYAKAHAHPQGPGDDRPTAIQVIQDEDMLDRLKSKIIVITGTSSGIGVETARALSLTGATLFLTARDVPKARKALEGTLDLKRTEFIEMDQASLSSVRAAAGEILSKTDNINILINNAGVMAVQELQLTSDAHELQFGTNHLSHFLFFNLLKPALLKAILPSFHSRVVIVTSSSHVKASINSSDNYDFRLGGYDPWVAYAQSKTANVYMANELERRHGAQGLHGISVHPGAALTCIGKHVPEGEIKAITSDEELKKIWKNAEQGAAVTVVAAVSREWEGRGGRYLVDCVEADTPADETNIFSSGYARHTYKPEDEGRLWADSLALVGL
ncbi:hypothetical protein FANTH_13451 [Fusarium anthophilum]|uniref:Reductase n=1 Tax=Fusarium anthophilum TaxID=48485 RepID=A0A8H5DPW0_9HYPO|nr:hypothetical protein FANTH_13451 [Fusarium anthophilum]